MAVTLDYTQFHEVFKPDGGSPYNQHLVRDIEAKRKALGGVLFVDRVLKALGITKAKVYPPRGENGLHSLHQQICAVKMAIHHKLSVLYYLLLDHDDGLSPRSQMAENFARQTGIPKKYQIFMKGLWYMDRVQFNLALEYLAHPSLQPEFADDIVTVLVRNADNDDYSSALAYYYSVKPVLKTPQALELLFGAIAKTSVTEAFYFSRKHPEPARKELFCMLVSSVLGDTGLDIGTRSADLVSLPLDSSEEAWFEEYLTTGDGKKIKKAKDTMMMRKLVTGRHADSIGEKNLGPQWNIVLQGLKFGMGGRVE